MSFFRKWFKINETDRGVSVKRILLLLTCLFAHALGANLSFLNNCLEGSSVSLDFLWWDARGDELIYAITREGFHDESGNGIVDNLHSKSHMTKPQWNPGVRVHAEKILSCPDIVCFGEYTWYQTNDKQSTSLSAPSHPQSYLQMQSDFLFGQEVLTFSRILSGKLESDFFFNMNRVDLGFEKKYSFCERGRLIPFVSATYLHTDQNLTVKANTTLPFSVIVNQKDRVDTKYDGFGGQLGLWGDWALIRGFSLYAGASITGTYGKFSGNNHFKYSSNQFGSSILTDQFKLNYWTGRVISDLKIGLNYQVRFYDCYDLSMHIGWELQTLFDQTNWINRAGLAGRSSNQSAANLHLQGFVAGAEFAF